VRITFALIFIALIVALTICHKYTRKSNKAIAFSVAMLIGALIPPLIYTHVRDEMLKKATVNMNEVFQKRTED